MEEVKSLLAEINRTADDILDINQQLVSLDARRQKTREALNRHREQKNKYDWICIGDMFIRLTHNDTRNFLVDEQYLTDKETEELRESRVEKVEKLNKLEGKPELTGFKLKPLKRDEIQALRAGFKL